MTINLYPPMGQSNNNPVYVQFGGTQVDAFGRLRISQPYTLFDSQQRYSVDSSFDSATTGTGSVSFLSNQSSAALSVTSGGVGSVVRQTYRYFPYQPGKSLLILATFCMDSSTSSSLTQRVGLFDSNNGVFFQRIDSTVSFVLRSNSIPTPGTPSDVRTVNQSSWNGDKLDGTGPSGYVLDATKTQIFWTDIEWLGVGSVRCGFVINGQLVTCHTFYNSNVQTSVYMTTAVLPIRYEITSTVALSATMKQICCSVNSEGGYEETSQIYWARMAGTSGTLGNVPTTNVFFPLVSIRLNSSHLGAVVLPNQFAVLPITSDKFEVAVVKNVGLTGASWVTGTFQDVDYDVSATAFTSQPSGTQIAQIDYVTSTSQATTNVLIPLGYKWDLQLGVSLAGVSDVLTLAVRSIGASGAANTVYGSFGFYDLTI